MHQFILLIFHSVRSLIGVFLIKKNFNEPRMIFYVWKMRERTRIVFRRFGDTRQDYWYTDNLLKRMSCSKLKILSILKNKIMKQINSRCKDYTYLFEQVDSRTAMNLLLKSSVDCMNQSNLLYEHHNSLINCNSFRSINMKWIGRC